MTDREMLDAVIQRAETFKIDGFETTLPEPDYIWLLGLAEEAISAREKLDRERFGVHFESMSPGERISALREMFNGKGRK